MKAKTDWKQDNEKEAIIENIKLYLKGEKMQKESIIKQLEAFAWKYHITLTKVPRIQLYDALNIFKENKRGYAITINQLYSAL